MSKRKKRTFSCDEFARANKRANKKASRRLIEFLDEVDKTPYSLLGSERPFPYEDYKPMPQGSGKQRGTGDDYKPADVFDAAEFDAGVRARNRWLL